MLPRFFTNGKLWLLLLAFDEDLAEKARLKSCPLCEKPLHQANYQRKPRGGPPELDDSHALRFSFCCYECRKRLTPPSIRFFGRKVYFGIIFLLISAMLGGASPERRRRLQDLCGADARTLGRWKTWWEATFAKSDLWRDLSARLAFMRSSVVPLPRLLIRSLKIQSLQESLVGVLKLLRSMTSRKGVG